MYVRMCVWYKIADDVVLEMRRISLFVDNDECTIDIHIPDLFFDSPIAQCLIYSGLTRHITAAAATLSITTPTAVDKVVIC